VHICVRAESIRGRRLNPSKADLHRWRETFAEKLRGYGVAAEATRQAARGQSRSPDALWRLKAKEDRRLTKVRPINKPGGSARARWSDALGAWSKIKEILAGSPSSQDAKLALAVGIFMQEMFGSSTTQIQQRESSPEQRR
jgi:hypothetical protein